VFNFYVPSMELFIFGIGVILLATITKNKKILFSLSMIGAILSFISLILVFSLNESNNIFQFDFAGTIFSMIFVFSLIVTLIGSYNFNYKKMEIFYTLLLFSTGAMILASYSNNLIAMFVTFETASISTYALSAFTKEKRSLEASLKFFVIGALSSAFLLLGISYYYIATGTFQITSSYKDFTMFMLSFIFFIIGFGFKLSLFPFHSWAVDTYTGSRAPISSFLSTASKLMALVIMLRLMLVAFPLNYVNTFFIVLSIITMFYGNITAIMQKDVKRMLAYSSIANAGYMVLVFTVSNSALGDALGAIILFAIAYVIMKGGSFISMEAFENNKKETTLESISGLGKTNPILAFSLSVLLLSLAGVPPTIGFMGKFYLFLSLVESGLVWLAIVAVINSAISVYYYFRVIMYMYWKEPSSGNVKLRNVDFLVLFLALIAIILGIFAPFYFSGLLNAWGGIP